VRFSDLQRLLLYKVQSTVSSKLTVKTQIANCWLWCHLSWQYHTVISWTQAFS